MVVPKINDWVACRRFYFGPGKVSEVDDKMKLFKADFLTEPDFDVCIEASDWLMFSEIEYVISDPAEITKLEKEHRGKLEY